MDTKDVLVDIQHTLTVSNSLRKCLKAVLQAILTRCSLSSIAATLISSITIIIKF